MSQLHQSRITSEQKNRQLSFAFDRASVFSFFLLSGSIAALTLYLRPSGTIQPAHLALFLFSAVYLTFRPWRFESWSTLFAVIVLYVAAVEAFYNAFTSVTSGLITSAYFLYNLVVSLGIYAFVRKYGSRSVEFGIYGAALYILYELISTGFDLRGIDAAGRAVAGFNNPNQLGFFSCILLSFGYLFYRVQAIPYLVAVAIFAVSLFFSILSLSKAALVANLVVIFIALKPEFSKRSISLWFGVSGALFFAVFWFVQKGAFDDYLFFSRLTNALQEQDSSLEARGYFVLAQATSWQVLFGLGVENARWIQGFEIHSTPAAMLGNYGVLGLALFAGLLLTWAKRLWKAFGLVGLVSIAAPSMLYGLTHNGTRFTFFWILFATSLAIAARQSSSKTS
jgi:hypothetical protein